MNKLGKALQVHFGLINAYDLLKRFGIPKKDDIYIYHLPWEPRLVGGTCSIIFSPSHPTDLQSHWSAWGCKRFPGERSESFPKALDWASKKYGIEQWVNNPLYGFGYVPKSVVERAKRALSERTVRKISEA